MLDEDRDLHYTRLREVADLSVSCVGDESVYRTTGKGTIRTEKGREYLLFEKEIEHPSEPGKKVFMTYVDFGSYNAIVRFSERVEIRPQGIAAPTVNPESIHRGILEANILPTRQQLQQAIENFVAKNPGRKPIDFYMEHGLYEGLTVEFVEALAGYLEERICALQARTGKPVTLLEVGAGDGRLSHFLKKELDKRGVAGYRIVATDAMGGQWQIRPLYPVQREVVDMALWDFQPQIVLTSWMPRNEDWTEYMRHEPSVDEYVLIGPKDSGLCGLDDATWGRGIREGTSPPYEKDGFERVDLPELSALQMGQKDRDGNRYSATVSFRRKNHSLQK